MARVVVTGATGTIGRALVSALSARGDEVAALVRDTGRAHQALGDSVVLHAWTDPKWSPPPREALAGADAVVHLLGEPVAQRWSPRVKEEIRESRVRGTRSLVAGLRATRSDERPRTLISQSATGYYGPRGDQPLDELAPPGSDFLAEVVAAWEREAMVAERQTRVVVTRTGVVLAAGAGALAQMLPPFRLGVGGPVAGGRQYVPWIHLDDVVGGFLHCLDHPELHGGVNLTAPNPVTNGELARALGRALRRPAVLPVPGFALHVLYGEMAVIVTTGQRVVPGRLSEAGYEFRYSELEPALLALLR